MGNSLHSQLKNPDYSITFARLLQITQPPLLMGLFVFAEPAAWKIKRCNNPEPKQVNNSQVETTVRRTEQKW